MSIEDCFFPSALAVWKLKIDTKYRKGLFLAIGIKEIEQMEIHGYKLDVSILE